MKHPGAIRNVFVLAGCLSAGWAAAQTPPVFQDGVSYDAWKAQWTATLPVEPPHPGPPSTGTGTERDSVATCDCWVTPDASYTTINNNTEWNASGWGNGDDGSYGPITLPFNFYLYGQNYTTAYININGNISFGPGNWVSTFSSTPFPMSGPALVAPFWADVDLRGGAVGQNLVQYKVTPTAMYVNWTNVGYYSMHTDKLNTFQVIITDGTDLAVPGGANVSFCYGTMEWTTGDASSGTNGFYGTPATVGANKGDAVNYIQFGRFDHDGTDYNGPFGAPSGIGWLSDKYFNFTTDITTGNLAPVITGQSVCDSLTVCTGVPALLSVDFLSPEPLQTTTASSTSATLSNYNVVSSTSGNTASITTGFTPSLADLGYHDVYFEGADDGTPPLTSTLHIVVHVLASPDLGNAAAVLCDNDTTVDMLTLLGGNPTPGGTWMDTVTNTTVSNLFTPGVTPDGAYRYSVDNGGGCAAQAILTINTLPHADAGGDTSLAYCSWDFPDLLFQHLPGTPQYGGAWQDPGGTSFNGTLDPGTAVPGTFLYVVAGNAPCLNDTAFVDLAIPQAVDAGQDSSIVLCRDAAPFSMQAMLAGNPDTTGTWADVNGAVVADLFDPATGLIGVYTYSVPAVLPCPSLTAVLTLNLDPLPQAGLDSSLVVCANDGDTPLFPLLGGAPDTGGVWKDPFGSELPDGVLDPGLEVSGIYLYVATGPGTCAHLTDTSLVDVLVNPLPVITYTAEPDSGCVPLEVTFTNTTDPIYVGGDCQWDVGDGSVPVDSCGTFTHVFTEPGWYHLKLKVTTPEGCTDQLIAPGAVLADPVPVGTFMWTPDPITAGNNRVVFTGTDPHAVEFFWTMPDLSQLSGQQVEYTFPDEIAGNYPLCLSVRDRYGCADTLCDTLSVFVDNLWAPTAFTPDGNHVNDVFHVVTTDMAPEDYHLRIFDRWGKQVFETTAMDQGWDGRGRNGGKPVLGVYVWRLEYRPLYTSDKLERTGFVTLLK
jgi:gliding motility-associated-like protein